MYVPFPENQNWRKWKLKSGIWVPTSRSSPAHQLSPTIDELCRIASSGLSSHSRHV